jgi:hypothetical protein
MKYITINLYVILKYRSPINVIINIFPLLVTQCITKFKIDLDIRTVWETVCADL